MRRLAAAGAALAIAAAASAQTAGTPRGIALGPRLLEYDVTCAAARSCQVECFQQGQKIASVVKIGPRDTVSLMASSSAAGEVTPNWIEIRPSAGGDARTLLLSRDTFCDLEGLVISPKNRP